MEEIDKSNLELYKSQSQSRLKSLRKILITIIRTMPLNEVIEVLKEKKIVKYEYCEEKDDLVLIERINTIDKSVTTSINKASLGGEDGK